MKDAKVVVLANGAPERDAVEIIDVLLDVGGKSKMVRCLVGRHGADQLTDFCLCWKAPDRGVHLRQSYPRQPTS